MTRQRRSPPLVVCHVAPYHLRLRPNSSDAHSAAIPDSGRAGFARGPRRSPNQEGVDQEDRNQRLSPTSRKNPPCLIKSSPLTELVTEHQTATTSPSAPSTNSAMPERAPCPARECAVQAAPSRRRLGLPVATSVTSWVLRNGCHVRLLTPCRRVRDASGCSVGCGRGRDWPQARAVISHLRSVAQSTTLELTSFGARLCAWAARRKAHVLRSARP